MEPAEIAMIGSAQILIAHFQIDSLDPFVSNALGQNRTAILQTAITQKPERMEQDTITVIGSVQIIIANIQIELLGPFASNVSGQIQIAIENCDLQIRQQ